MIKDSDGNNVTKKELTLQMTESAVNSLIANNAFAKFCTIILLSIDITTLHLVDLKHH